MTEADIASRLKILHVNSEKNWAGGEVQNFLLMDYLSRKGYTIYLACRPQSAIEKRALAANYRVATFEMRNYLDVPAILRIKNYLVRERFHIVHLHTSRAHVLAGIAAYLARVPIVIVTRRMDYPLKKYFFTRFLYRTIVDRVVAISKGVKQAVLDAGISAEKIEIINSGIPLEKFDPAADRGDIRRELGIDPDAPLVAVIASFHRRKGHEYFLKAVGEVLTRLPQARFLLVGEGPLRKDMMGAAEAMGLGKSAIFTGRRNDIADVLAAIDVLVMPSLYEGLGVSILEAMAMAKPIVATCVGGIPEIVRDGENGFLVAPKDSAAMAEKLLLLLQERPMARLMGQRGRAVVCENFSAWKMARDNERLYHRLLEEKEIIV